MPDQTTKRLLLQGATGSIGASVLSVVRSHTHAFRITGIAARSNLDCLADAMREFRPDSVALEDMAQTEPLKQLAEKFNVKHVYCGSDALLRQAEECDYDLYVNAVMGGAGLEPTAAALRRGKSTALANKETLVAAGPIMLELAQQSGATLIPIDSEHSALFQCLIGEAKESIRHLWLTTSGGPFWDRRQRDLTHVSVREALGHPTWKMGPKITIDSATLFNKGLEIIEAQRLFDMPPDRIRIAVHRQSVVHSMVEFVDGSFKAQFSTPDMRLPILYALSYPNRITSDLVQTDMANLATLTFEDISENDFPCLKAARDALSQGGTAPAAISAADEVAVHAFLEGRIQFTDIGSVIQNVLDGWPDEPLLDLAVVRAADKRARQLAHQFIGQLT
jgi:1-deoxy-D-xylulose-5-phosphate reductoisomerase